MFVTLRVWVLWALSARSSMEPVVQPQAPLSRAGTKTFKRGFSVLGFACSKA